MLHAGAILAVKGLGGYHLACDARNPAAVAALRDRKYRKEKPFALMVRDVEMARTLVELSPRRGNAAHFRRPTHRARAGTNRTQRKLPRRTTNSA